MISECRPAGDWPLHPQKSVSAKISELNEEGSLRILEDRILDAIGERDVFRGLSTPDPSTVSARNGVVNSHSADAPGDLSFLALIEEKKDILLLAGGGPVDAVHQPLEGILFVGVTTTHDHETLAFGYELKHFSKYLGAFRSVNWVIRDSVLASRELPCVQLLRDKNAVIIFQLASEGFDLFEAGGPPFADRYQRRVNV